MNRRAKRIVTSLLVVAAIGCALLWQPAREPVYQGRRVADWVKRALYEESRAEASEAVLRIGAPAVPFIVQQGLRNKYHKLYFLSDDYVAGFGLRHRWLGPQQA